MCTRLLWFAILCIPPFICGCGCDNPEKEARIATLEQSLEAERQHTANLDHARRIAVDDARALRNELQAERTRRGWSDTYAIATAGAYLVALALAGLLLWWRWR